MPEGVLFKPESGQSQEGTATLLWRITDNFENGDAITLRAGNESVTLEPPAHPTFEVKTEREGLVNGSGELSIEFEFERDEDGSNGGGGNGPLEIE